MGQGPCRAPHPAWTRYGPVLVAEKVRVVYVGDDEHRRGCLPLAPGSGGELPRRRGDEQHAGHPASAEPRGDLHAARVAGRAAAGGGRVAALVPRDRDPRRRRRSSARSSRRRPGRRDRRRSPHSRRSPPRRRSGVSAIRVAESSGSSQSTRAKSVFTRPGGHAVHANVVGAELGREIAGELHQGGLRRGVAPRAWCSRGCPRSRRP